MMNLIWGGLILISILFATGHDLYDEIVDIHENSRVYNLTVVSSAAQPPLHGQSVTLSMADNIELSGRYQINQDQRRIVIVRTEPLPQQWQDRLQEDGKTITIDIVNSQLDRLRVRLPEIHWQKLSRMMQAGFDMAEFAAKLALGLIGLMALWLGLMKIAEESGLVQRLVRLVRPVLKPIFPDVPDDHPAMGAISLNLSANMLGLGNAATPMGIKAMQHLQELNGHKDTASNSMCMFLALNTSSVQLLPPVTVIALLGVNASGLFLSIFLATLCSTVVAFLAARWFARHDKSREAAE